MARTIEPVKDSRQERNNRNLNADIRDLEARVLINKTAAPSVGDDVGDGINVGAIWVDTTNDNVNPKITQKYRGAYKTPSSSGMVALEIKNQGQGERR